MRAVMIYALVALSLLLLAGCAAVPGGQPILALPVALADLSLRDGDALSPQQIDLTGDEHWVKNTHRIAGYEGATLSASVVNETGSATDPAPVRVRFYLSPRGDLKPAKLDSALLLLTTDLPAGMHALQYDSGVVALPPQIADLLAGGRCFLYIVAEKPGLSLQLMHARLEFTARLNSG